jgi:predicted MFS family arabinose efflux permease
LLYDEVILTQITKSTSLSHKLNTFFGLHPQIIGLVFFARLIIDVGTRMVFPFIPQIASGLDLTIVAFSWLIFIRGIAGIASPILGVWSDRYGRRRLMVGGLLAQSLGIIGVAFTQQWWAVLPMVFFGLALAAFIPAQQAYISDQVSYDKRGRALAAVEFSWAGAAIFFLPGIGWLIDTFGWRSPFFIVSLLSLMGTVFIWRYLPPAKHHTPVRLSWPEMGRLFLRPNVLASTTVALLLFVAATCFVSVWGIWLTTDFGLKAVTLGLVATAIGVAELTASGLSSLFIDRMGKRRGSGLGLLLSALTLLLLPLTQSYLPLAIVTLVVIGLFMEFTIVSLIPLYSEQAPEARGTVFSLILFGIAIGASAGTPITAILWETYGLWGVCIVAAICLFVAFGLMWKMMRE